MRFCLSGLFVAFLLAFQSVKAHGQEKNPHVAATPPLTPQEQLGKFHLPPGFVIELVAAEPKIKKPINIAFDALGRLWVTESVEYPYAAPSDRPGKDTVKIVSDFADNGLARSITTFADGLNIPIGVLPDSAGNGAIIYSIPNIYRMTDTDRDGKADKRDVLYSAYGFADTHGMTGEFVRGFDGWVYCCHGFSNTSTVKSKEDTTLTMQSGNVYRVKPDGSRIEYVTHGQVNPFGLAFDPLGNLYSCDCHSRPIYQLLKGAYYPSFGKPHDGLGFGPEMLRHDHGSTAIAGITYYAADQFPQEYRDNIFIGNVVTNRINRDRLETHGSTYKGIEMPDFLKCDDPWFRPVDIKLGPDGALYVADFYNRIIGHYEVPLNHPGRDREKGRIWRIVYRGPDGTQKPKAIRDLTSVEFPVLFTTLNDPNLTVRMHAMEQLIARGDEVVDSAQKIVDTGSALEKAHVIWVLERLGKLKVGGLARLAKDPDRLVRVHAMRVLTERVRVSALDRELARAGLTDDDAFVKRNAAAALGSHPTRDNLAPLLDLEHKASADDTHLLHVARMALRDQLRVPEVAAYLQKDYFREKNWTEADARSLAAACLGVHDAATAQFLKDFLVRVNDSFPNVQRYCHYVARFGADDSPAWVLEWMQKKYAGNSSNQGQVLKTVQQAAQERGSPLGKNQLALAEVLSLSLLNSDQAPLGIELAGLFKVPATQSALYQIVDNPKANKNLRKNAVVALLAIDAEGNTERLSRLLSSAVETIEVREQIASSMAATNTAGAHTALVKALETAPARLQSAIGLGLAGSRQGGEKLLDAVSAGKASARLLQEAPIAIRLQGAKIAKLNERVAALTKGLPSADQQLQDLLARRRAAFLKANTDVGVGLKVFEKHCAACHQIANQGAKIGPQLDGIGIRGVDRLLEDILDPNRNVDQAFRSTTLGLNNGQVVNGLVLRQEGTVLVLADNAGKEVRVPVADVQERVLSPLSPMPGNFAEQIADPDFHHMLAYLLAQRTKN